MSNVAESIRMSEPSQAKCHAFQSKDSTLKETEPQSLKREIFRFGEHSIEILRRKSLDKTLNFKLTVQTEKEDIFESLRDFGCCLDSESDDDGVEKQKVEGDIDLLGLDIWPATVRICEYMSLVPDIVRGKNVLELGAGIGLPCLLAAKLGARKAVISDYDPKVVSHAHENAIECGTEGICCGLLLDWTKLDALDYKVHSGAYDVVLAADVLYISQIMPDLVNTIEVVLKKDGLLVLAHQQRQSLVLDDSGTPVVIDEDVSFKKFKEYIGYRGFRMRVLGEEDTPGFPGPMMVLALSTSQQKLDSLQDFVEMKRF